MVATKLAKISEEVYVLNQQAVVLGNPNNAEEFTLPEGKHSWPFEFALPMQHIPSSGKVSSLLPLYSFSLGFTFLFISQHENNNTAIRQTNKNPPHTNSTSLFYITLRLALLLPHLLLVAAKNRNNAKELKHFYHYCAL